MAAVEVLPLLEELLLLAIAAFLAGLAGSYLGIGGGVFLIPFMTLALSIDIKVAIATSLIGVIATSSGAASVYVRDHLTNLRLAMFLEVGTTLGAIAGAVVGILVPNVYLFLTFGVVVLYAAASMVRVAETAKDRAYRGGEEERPLVKRLSLSSVYFDQEDQGVYRYRVERPVPFLRLSRRARNRHGRASPRAVRRRPVITARAGLRVVQHRIAALRRAVLTEVEDINRLIYHILRGGVVVSVAFLLFGFILAGVTGRPLPEH